MDFFDILFYNKKQDTKEWVTIEGKPVFVGGPGGGGGGSGGGSGSAANNKVDAAAYAKEQGITLLENDVTLPNYQAAIFEASDPKAALTPLYDSFRSNPNVISISPLKSTPNSEISMFTVDFLRDNDPSQFVLLNFVAQTPAITKRAHEIG